MIGNLYIFEGPDGVGKTTVAKAVHHQLQNLSVPNEYFSFPGRENNTIGNLVYTLHHDSLKYGIKSIDPICLQNLHISAHIEAITCSIIPKLKAGINIVLDRYWWSTYVYGKIDNIPDKILIKMIELEKLVWGSVRPKFLFLLDNAEPFKYEYSKEKWMQIKQEYDTLYLNEKQNHNTEAVTNLEIKSTVDKIIQKMNCP